VWDGVIGTRTEKLIEIAEEADRLSVAVCVGEESRDFVGEASRVLDSVAEIALLNVSVEETEPVRAT
jgi:hypothetical protein